MLTKEEHMKDVDALIFNPNNVINQREFKKWIKASKDQEDPEMYVIKCLLP